MPKKKKKKKQIELEEMNVILRIPKDAMQIDIECLIAGINIDVTTVKRTLTVGDIIKARSAFIDVVGDDDYDQPWIVSNAPIDCEGDANDKAEDCSK